MNEWVSEKLAEEPVPEERKPLKFEDADLHEEVRIKTRSIFDDIDE